MCLPLKEEISRRSRGLKGAIILALLLISSALALRYVPAGEEIKQPKVVGVVRFEPTPKPQTDRIRQITGSSVFSEFDVWAKQYLEGNLSGDADQLRRGETISATRRELLKELIRTEPELALDRSVSLETYNKLPPSISRNLEQRISAYGDFLVYVVMSHSSHHSEEMMSSRIEREVVIAGSRYKAAVYGRRETMTSKLGIPVQGVILDGWIALDETPLRRLEPTEYESHSVQLSRLDAFSVVAEVGGRPMYFSSQEEFEAFLREEIEWESKIGPTRDLAESAWTEGTKTVLFIRLDFPDKPGEPVDSSNQPLTVARAQSLIDTQVSPFYVANSYNKTSMTTQVTPVVRMPQPQSYYVSSGDLFGDAEAAAKAAGYDPNNYDLDIFAMSYNAGFPFAGVAAVGHRGAALNGSFGLKVTAHELGHNYGLLHANLWRTTDGSVIGPGDNVEYGNPFDVMGGGSDSRAHFNAHYKWRLGWLTDANVQKVTTDGIYRIFAHDSTTPSGIRILNIKKNGSKNYWVEFRQLFTDNSNVMNGAIVGWGYGSVGFQGNQENEILDMTPNTSTVTDAPLLIGQNFNDNENRIRFTVIGKGNTTPQSLDVKVEFNVGCTFSLNQTSQSFPATGGEGIIPVNTLSGCVPPSQSNDPWLSVFTTDTGTLHYIVAANYDSQSRTGTISVIGQTFTVQQGGATTACVPRPSGAVAWWRGEGNALDQVSVNNGQVVSNMSFAGAKIGGGFLGNYTNNAGAIEIPDSPSLALNKSMTFEGWLKVSSYEGSIIERRDDRSTGNLAPSYAVNVTASGRISFTIGFNKSQGTSFSSPDPIGLNQFVHYAITLDNATGQVKIYLNGGLVNQTITGQRPQTLDPNAKPTVYVGNINGITDELAVYNRALSLTEIQAIYNAGIASTGAAGKCLTSLCPSINNLSTNQARPGDPVTINGSGFLNVTAVKFSSNVNAAFTIVNDSQITTTIPADAVTGSITLSKANCVDAQSSSITIERCPSITGLSKVVAGVGDSITINGVGFLNLTGVKFGNLSASFSMVNDGQVTTVVPSGATTGPITLTKNNCANAVSNSVTVCPTSPLILAVDDGHAETNFGYQDSTPNSVWVNRLTPSSYPATLTAVLASVNLPAGTNIGIVAGANPGGTSNINNTISQTIATTVGAQNTFTYYAISPITITSGDFVVGYSFVPMAGFFPASLDTTPPSRNRSYYSTSGTSFGTFDSFNPGNLLIRAEIFPGSCPNSGPPAPIATAATNMTSNGFTANWNSSPGATGYRLDVSPSSSFGSYVSGFQDLDLGNVLSGAVVGLSPGTNFYYRVRSYNSAGQSGNSNTISTTTNVQVTIQTNPVGRSFTVDGTSYTATQTFNWTPGSSHTIATSTPQSGVSGTQYVWSNWSDGGAISHTVAPSSSITYTANFITQHFLTMNAGTGGTVGPVSGFFNAGQGVSISATAQNGFSFSGWSGSGSGSFTGATNPASVTMNGPITETASFTQNAIPVTVQTNPVGRSFTVDGTTYGATQTFNWTPGSSHTIATTSPQSGGTGTQFVWSNWSDGGAISHTVAPSSSSTYTANFTTQHFLTMSAGTGGTVSPASGFFNAGQNVSISATPQGGFSFSGWSGSGSGSFTGATNPASVTMNGPITETAGFAAQPGTTNLQFSSATFSATEGTGSINITVTRTGNTTGASTVDYRTTDADTFTVNCANKSGNAFARCDFGTVVGTLNFAAGETSKTIVVPIINDGYAEGNETFFLTLSNMVGATSGSPSTTTVTINDNETVDAANPIMQLNAAGVSFFVRQHYLDFLGREPEAGEPWSGVLNGCSDQNNTNPASPAANCDRIFVSGSFFGSPEFKDKGFYIIGMYRVAFNRLPSYVEFSTDLASISGTTAAEVFAKRAAYATNFVLRTEFTGIYGAKNNADYVNHLMSGGQGQNYNLTSITTKDPANPDTGAKVTLTTTDLLNRISAGTMTRGQVLRAIAQSDQITVNKEAVNAFVASQYYGYLRRTPDTGGFNGWVAYLTANPNDFRTMVHGFVNSTEYRLRFGIQ